MLSITSEIYFTRLKLNPRKTEKRTKKKKKNMENPIHRTLFKAWEGGRGMITVNKEKITVNQGIQNSREVC